jgi:NADPH:quinone reductase-like Zn-dependent oxidoreductase
MKQIFIPKPGPPEVLVVRETADPSPSRDQVRIRVEAAGINFADIMGRLGIYPDLPKMPVVPGYEVAGTIDSLGNDVDPRWQGKAVLAMTRFGGYADVVCVPQNQVFERPAGMSAQTGAAIPVNYITAFQLTTVMGSLRAGDTMLVHSAGGGVGIAATQIAKHIGAAVIGTASKSKHEFLAANGVDHLIDYRTEDFEKRTLEITHGRGVELILDAVGGESFKKGYRVLSPTGRIGMFGMSAAATGKTRSVAGLVKTIASMPWLQFNPSSLIDSNKGAFGVNVGHMWDQTERIAGWMEELLGLFVAGVVRPHVDRVFSFDEAAAAHHYIQDRKNVGKVLLAP